MLANILNTDIYLKKFVLKSKISGLSRESEKKIKGMIVEKSFLIKTKNNVL
jgi:hypothetical protein